MRNSHSRYSTGEPSSAIAGHGPVAIRSVFMTPLRSRTRRLTALRHVPELEADVGSLGWLRVSSQVALVIRPVRPDGVNHPPVGEPAVAQRLAVVGVLDEIGRESQRRQVVRPAAAGQPVAL